LLAPGARALDEHLDLAHAVLHRLARGHLGGERGGVRRALARALEAGDARRAPAHHRAAKVGDRDDRVVEGRLDPGVAHGDVLLLAAALLDRLLAFSHVASIPALLRGLAPSADCALRAAPLARIGLGPLPANGQVAPMPETSIRADLLEALDVERDLATQ